MAKPSTAQKGGSQVQLTACFARVHNFPANLQMLLDFTVHTVYIISCLLFEPALVAMLKRTYGVVLI